MKLRKINKKRTKYFEKDSSYFYSLNEYTNLAIGCIVRFAEPIKAKLLLNQEFITDLTTELIMVDCRYDEKKLNSKKYDRKQYMIYCGSKLIKGWITQEKKSGVKRKELLNNYRVFKNYEDSTLDTLIKEQEEQEQVDRIDSIIAKFKYVDQQIIELWLLKTKYKEICSQLNIEYNYVRNVIKKFKTRLVCQNS